MRRVALFGTLVFGFSALTGLAGCGAPSRDPAAPTAQSSGLGDDGAGCHSERRVGSNISREVCRTPEEVARDREDARDLMRPGRVPLPDPKRTSLTPGPRIP